MDAIPPGYQAFRSTRPPLYSSWGNRVGAYFLRSLVAAVAAVPLLILLGVTLIVTSSGGEGEGRSATSGLLIGLTVVLVIAGYVMSFIIQARQMIQRGRLGYDFADAVVNQRLVRAATDAPLGSGWSVFGRTLLNVVNALPCYLGFIAPLFTPKKQTFADMIMGTVVVEETPRHTSKELIVNSFTFWRPVLTPVEQPRW